MLQRIAIELTGQVQGLGLRPSLFTIATHYNLTGFVRNELRGVRIEIQGERSGIESFLDRLTDYLHKSHFPPHFQTSRLTVQQESAFKILASHTEGIRGSCLAPDLAMCLACKREISDAKNRRYQYPFTTCARCGPRLTILDSLPYDRSRTTMRTFAMCPRCQGEYEAPSDRRFHAQSLACPQCGPSACYVRTDELAFEDSLTTTDNSQAAMRACITELQKGGIVAVKGIGGFHLVCDATNERATNRLRQDKARGDKPFAIMVRNLEALREIAEVSPHEAALLTDVIAPIVLLRRRSPYSSSSYLNVIAPGQSRIGAMLPYSPLHQLLSDAVECLVVTSGNVTGAPIARTFADASSQLAVIADGFLTHNRPIRIAVDDSVVASLHEEIYPIRRSRGFVPRPIEVADGPCVIGIGAELKSTICLAVQDQAILGPHAGDVGNIETLDLLRTHVAHFQALFRPEISAIAGDLHPGYLSSRWGKEFAESLDCPFIEVQHHHAHAVSLLAEHAFHEPAICCCFDGTGFGIDGSIWGGEFLIADAGGFTRPGHLSHFPLAGGDASIQEPFRVALSLLREAQLLTRFKEKIDSFGNEDLVDAVLQQLDRGLNTIPTTSMGRLFDGVASLIGLRHRVSYEAQAAMELEAIACSEIETVAPNAYRFSLSPGDQLVVDYLPVLRAICEDSLRGVSPSTIAAKFHHSVARMITDVCESLRDTQGINTVGLTGGVFQNLLLTRLATNALRAVGFKVLRHRRVPPNDGGIALGQAIIARTQLKMDRA